MPQIYRRASDSTAAGDSVPFFHDGTYHLFHLSSPADSLGHQYPYRCTMSQRHVSSTDLVTWVEHPTALVPSEPYDKDGCWTGSIVERDGRYFLFYTGHSVGSPNPQTICLATSSDGVTFEKSAANPLLRPDPRTYESVDFRDPFIFWNEEEGRYWMLIAARLASGPVGRRGCIALSTSSDLERWSEPEPFYTPFSTFCPECPEMFKLGDHWFLVYSHFSESARTTYRVSPTPRGPWRTPGVPGLDGRRFYAAKSMPTDDPRRRLMWGSIYERVAAENNADWTYAGDFGAPREIRATDDGNLTVGLPRELIDAFGAGEPVSLDPGMGEWAIEGGQGRVSVPGTFGYALGELPVADGPVLVTCTLAPQDDGGEFGILIRPEADLGAAHALVFDPPGQRVCLTLQPQPLDPFWAALTAAKVPPAQIDGPRLVERPLPIGKGRSHSVQILMEQSLIEIFVDGRVALSYRIYGDNGRLGVFAQDTDLTVSDLRVCL